LIFRDSGREAGGVSMTPRLPDALAAVLDDTSMGLCFLPVSQRGYATDPRCMGRLRFKFNQLQRYYVKGIIANHIIGSL
jgi:hypothetical protein